MKSLLIISANDNPDGTMLTCLLARHLIRVTHWRLLILELAVPPRCAQVPASTQHDQSASRNRVPVLAGCAWSASGRVCVLTAGAEGLLSIHDDPGRTRYCANLRHLLSRAVPCFDDCLIDTPALPDLRAVCAEALADAVLSPILPSPQCIECACEVIHGTYGIRNVRTCLNPALRFLGRLPVVDGPVSMEKAWAKVMETTLREWLIVDRAFCHAYAYLPLLACARCLGEPATRGAWAIAQDARAFDDSRTMVACLDVLTRRIGSVRNGAVPGLCEAGVCNA
ncbi:P-loop NTPase family protein [Paraburkholderia nodosa]|uniref:cobalamin biosynthesis protein CobQ n=1 Tax=Paraburkholderia nodosa TaxID=392320 RepID=UPI000489ECE7|nr:cobalamin biosynthesis protein CobQ [Paraburkholderia nodosa]